MTFTKKVLRVKRDDMRKLVAVAISLLSLSLSVTTGRRYLKQGRTRTGKKCSQKQLGMVDKALSRAGMYREDQTAEGSWICLSHRNLILAEDKRCSCPSMFSDVTRRNGSKGCTICDWNRGEKTKFSIFTYIIITHLVWWLVS